MWPVVIVVVFGLPTVLFPFGFDQSNHAFIAWRCLEGQALYTDIFSLKPPMTTVMHGLSQRLFGHHMAAIRVLDLLWMACDVTLVARLVRQLFPRQPGWTAVAGAGAYALQYYTLSHWHSAQTDGWANLPVTLSLLLVTRTTWSTGRASVVVLLLSGASAGLTLGIKYTLAPMIALPCLAAALAPADDRRARAHRVGWVLAGVALSTGVMILGLAAAGALDGFLDHHLTAVLDYGQDTAGKLGAGRPLPVRLLSRLLEVGPALVQLGRAPSCWLLSVTAACVAPLLLWRRRRDPDSSRGLLVALAWWGCAWASTAIQDRFFVYHFSPTLAPISVLTAYALQTLTALLARGGSGDRRARNPTARSGECRRQRLVVAGLSLAFFAASLDGDREFHTSPLHEYEVLFGELQAGFDLETHWRARRFLASYSFVIGDALTAATTIARLARPGDRLFVWGTNVAPYFLTQLPPVTSVYTSVQVADDLTREIDREQWLSELQAELPRFVVIQRGDSMDHILPDFRGSLRELLRFPALHSLLGARYHPVGRAGSLQVLALNRP